MTQEHITPLPYLNIVLSIYNQENLVERVLRGIFNNTTTPFTLILIFDGCTDRTEERALAFIKKSNPKLLRKLITDHAPNVFETKANNIGFKKVQADYMITLQDDMVVNEYGWERRLTYPLRKFDDVLAVTARTAQDLGTLEGNLEEQNYFTHAAEYAKGTLSRNIFAVRDTINRGPVAFTMKHLRALNYFDEAFSPSDLDDADLSMRAWLERNLRVGAFSIDYISRSNWGKARSKDSTMYAGSHIPRNAARLKERYSEYLLSGKKHSQDIPIPESEIDYISGRPVFRNFIKRIIRNL